MADSNPAPSNPDSLRKRIERTIDLLRGTTVNPEPYHPGEHDDLINFDGIPGEEEVERYWLNKPYAFAVITFNDDHNQHYYYVIEPELDETEQLLLEAMLDDIRDSLIYKTTDESGTDPLRSQIKSLLEEYGTPVSSATLERLYYYLFKTYQGYGRIDPILHDPYVEDISCDGYDLPVFVYHADHDDLETNISYQQEELDSFVTRLAQISGRHISIGEPTVEATLPNGSRAELALGEEVTPRGSAYTIRKYNEDPLTPVDLINFGTFNVEQMAYLWLAIENNMSLIFAGGTASGKTTSMNAISMFVPPRSKILSIEDTRELTLKHDNWLSNITRDRVEEGTDVTMYDLLRSALRHRPEYIIVGEVRGEEAMTLFQAMNTGHTTYSTMHADSVQTVINRLENDPINVPRSMIQSLDILCVQRLVRTGGERARRNGELAEIHDMNQRTGELDYSELFKWQPDTDTFTGDAKQSSILEKIREKTGQSHADTLRELRQRQRVLEYLIEHDITDYEQFTAVVNEYYFAPDDVIDTIDSNLDAETLVEEAEAFNENITDQE